MKKKKSQWCHNSACHIFGAFFYEFVRRLFITDTPTIYTSCKVIIYTIYNETFLYWYIIKFGYFSLEEENRKDNKMNTLNFSVFSLSEILIVHIAMLPNLAAEDEWN